MMLGLSLAGVHSRADPAADLNYPEHLPVVARREILLATLRDHQVVVIAGRPGREDDTVAQDVLARFRQPRPDRPHPAAADRVARSVAGADREELGEPLGPEGTGIIGFRCASPTTAVIAPA